MAASGKDCKKIFCGISRISIKKNFFRASTFKILTRALSVVKVALAPMISGPLSSTSEPVSQQIENYYSAEMQAKTHIINGGSTFRLLDGRDMVGQLNKASVSIFPDRSKLVKGQEVTKEDLTSFIEENMDILYGNEDLLTVGTWFDHDSNQTYIDAITV